MRRRNVIAVLTLAAALAACGGAATTPAAVTTPTATPEPATSSTAGPATHDELNAIRFRTSAGLRADLDYVRVVAADPRSSSREYSVPLLPDEIAELQARSRNADEVGEVVSAEARAHPEDFCGRWIDNQNGGALTSGWRANLLVHEAAIRLKLDPLARAAFVPCTYSLQDLRALQDRVGADSDWFESLDIALQSVGVDQVDNVLDVEVSSKVPNVRDIIVDRYGVPPGMIRVTSDGTGAYFVPWGEVDVTVVGPDGVLSGAEIAALELYPGWGSDVNGLRCGHGDVGVGFTNLPCQAGTWTITVTARIADGEWVSIGEGKVTVAGGKTSKLTIEIGPVPTYRPG